MLPYSINVKNYHHLIEAEWHTVNLAFIASDNGLSPVLRKPLSETMLVYLFSTLVTNSVKFVSKAKHIILENEFEKPSAAISSRPLLSTKRMKI